MNGTPIITDELHVESHMMANGRKVTNVYATSSDFAEDTPELKNPGYVWEVTCTEASEYDMVATGHLLYAAWDMLTMLRWLRRHHLPGDVMAVIARVNSVIAKAEGKT